tara:strand:+ start:138 stop:401 length:264 start_codon:yes stop_codon:yes gene_type:complete
MNEPIKKTEIRLPIYWASYLAHCDASGLEDGEETIIQETLEWAELTNHECIDVKEDISFERPYIPGLLAGDFCTYVFINRPTIKAKK